MLNRCLRTDNYVFYTKTYMYFNHLLNALDAKTRWSNLFKLIDSFSYMICLTVSEFHDFLNIKSMSDNDNEKTLFLKVYNLRH